MRCVIVSFIEYQSNPYTNSIKNQVVSHHKITRIITGTIFPNIFMYTREVFTTRSHNPMDNDQENKWVIDRTAAACLSWWPKLLVSRRRIGHQHLWSTYSPFC